MKRWLLVLLTLLLPLQLAWASVADYCGDTHQPAASQGPHQHGPAPEAGEGPVGAESGLDCGHCHGHSMAMPQSLVPSRLLLPSLGSSVPLVRHATPPPNPRPERPQWPRLA